ncbi:MAG: hypothetical protein JO111_17715 [Caulobacteraceae bacterium]|nr:hypothetical protein [Caulobacteraceae bacterium]
MSWLKTIWGEILGLFVDDKSLALVILAWLVVAGVVVALKWIPADLQGPVFVLGLVVIFLENTLRRARSG